MGVGVGVGVAVEHVHWVKMEEEAVTEEEKTVGLTVAAEQIINHRWGVGVVGEVVRRAVTGASFGLACFSFVLLSSCHD